MKTKIISPVKKIKQKYKKSPNNKSLDKYREFISGKKNIPVKDKRVIQVKRKKIIPKPKKENIESISNPEDV